MTSPQADARSSQTLHIALSTNEGRVDLFRLLAAYELAEEGYEQWIQRWQRPVGGYLHDHLNANYPLDADLYGHLSNTYMVAWKELGSDLFWRYMRLGHTGNSTRRNA